MSTTNANSVTLAAHLAELRGGSFVGLVVRKEGVERGPKGAKVRYGDDLVHVVLISGFRYTALCERSLVRLRTIDPDEIVQFCADRGITDGDGLPIIRAAVDMAIADLHESLTLSMLGLNESTTDHVYEPLMLDGEVVRGCRVYRCRKNITHVEDPEKLDVLACKCRDCTGDPKAPRDGTIYLQGLQVGSKVLEPAPNGPVPASKSRPDVVAKNIIRRRLPIGRYVSYRLEPGCDFILRAGGVAATAADGDGVELRDHVEIDEVFTLASNE